MTEYLIMFNDEWTGENTDEDLRAKSNALRPLIADMEARGVLIFTGGLDDSTPVYTADASSGSVVVSDGPFVESKEHLGGFAVINAADDEEAQHWAGKLAVACGWPQQVHQFRKRSTPPETRT